MTGFEAERNSPFGRADGLLVLACLLAILLAYVGLHGIYRPENTDDAWFLSVARNHVVNGIESDVSFGSTPGAGGLGGVELFGKTFSWLYGSLLNTVGWTKSNAHLISTLCMLAAAFCWAGILLRLKFGRRLAVFFGLSLLLVEPFFGAANQARTDALSFLAVSGALLLFLQGRYGLAGFLAMVALEIHPVGVAVFFFIGSAVAAGWVSGGEPAVPWRRAAPRFAAGVAAGCAYYVALHASFLGLLPAALARGNLDGSERSNILFEYFFKTRYLRHIPELIAIAGCAVYAAWKRPVRDTPFVPVFFLAAILFVLAVRRPNFMYAIYLYPAFLLLLLRVFEGRGRLGLAVGLLLLYLLPQYGVVYARNRHGDPEAYLNGLRALVPAGAEPILGAPNAWFALVDRPFYRVDYQGDFGAVAPGKLILVEDEAFRGGAFADVKRVIDGRYDATEIGRFQDVSGTIVVKSLEAKPR
jgi:hypothetical protein